MGVRWEVGLVSKCVATAGVPTRMLRNLGMLKSALWRPTRLDQYRAGPFDVSFTRSATNAIGTNKMMVALAARARSKSLIRNFLGHPLIATRVARAKLSGVQPNDQPLTEQAYRLCDAGEL